MNMSYEQMVQLASAGLQAAGIVEKAAFETAQFLALAELNGHNHQIKTVAQNKINITLYKNLENP
jgi:(2R)-3-sulfolactate dehydrogenase (NADP+)